MTSGQPINKYHNHISVTC